jgi:hypothetical protein
MAVYLHGLKAPKRKLCGAAKKFLNISGANIIISWWGFHKSMKTSATAECVRSACL